MRGPKAYWDAEKPELGSVVTPFCGDGEGEHQQLPSERALLAKRSFFLFTFTMISLVESMGAGATRRQLFHRVFDQFIARAVMFRIIILHHCIFVLQNVSCVQVHGKSRSWKSPFPLLIHLLSDEVADSD